jgi:hypothetical protein
LTRRALWVDLLQKAPADAPWRPIWSRAAAAGPDHRHDPGGAGDANVPITAANIA